MSAIDGSNKGGKFHPQCEDPEECFKCLTSQVAPSFRPRLKFIPRWLFKKCDKSSTLNSNTFNIMLFVRKNLEFKKLAKSSGEDLVNFIKEIVEGRIERENYWKKQGEAKDQECETKLFMESNVLFALEAELHRAFNRLKRSTDGFAEAQEKVFSTLEDPSDLFTGYSDINFWYDSILQDAYLLRTRLFLTMDCLYALHLADTEIPLNYVSWKIDAMKTFNETFDIPLRNRIVHKRFVEARSPVLMYLLRVKDEIKERFSKDPRFQKHLKLEQDAWKKYLVELQTSTQSYSTFVQKSVTELGLFV